MCHTRADVEDELTAEGGAWGAVGVSSCATALVNKVNFKHRLNVMGNIICARCQRMTSQRRRQAGGERGGAEGGAAAIDAKVFGQKTAETVRRCLRWQNLRHKTFEQSKNFGSASLFIHRVEVVVAVCVIVVAASFNSQHTILAFAIICVYNSHLGWPWPSSPSHIHIIFN